MRIPSVTSSMLHVPVFDGSRICRKSRSFYTQQDDQLLLLIHRVKQKNVRRRTDQETYTYILKNQFKTLCLHLPGLQDRGANPVLALTACQKTSINLLWRVGFSVPRTFQGHRSTDHPYLHIWSHLPPYKHDLTLNLLNVRYPQLIFEPLRYYLSIPVQFVDKLYGSVKDELPQTTVRLLLQYTYPKEYWQHKSFQIFQRCLIRWVRLIQVTPYPFWVLDGCAISFGPCSVSSANRYGVIQIRNNCNGPFLNCRVLSQPSFISFNRSYSLTAVAVPCTQIMSHRNSTDCFENHTFTRYEYQMRNAYRNVITSSYLSSFPSSRKNPG